MIGWNLRERRPQEILGVVLVVLFAGLVLHEWFNRGPKFRGKPGQYWANQLVRGGAQEHNLAELALRQLGPEASVPALIRALHAKGSPLYRAIWLKLPKTLQIRLPNALADENNRYRAALVLGTFGPAAKSAIPDLIDGLQSSNIDLIFASADALAAMGSEARSAIPILETMATNQSQYVSKLALNTLEKIRGADTNRVNDSIAGKKN